MISYWFYIFISGAWRGVAQGLTYLPDVSLPPEIASGFVAAGNYISIIWQIAHLFITALLVCVAGMVSVEHADGIFKLIKFAYKKIPGIN